MLPQNENGTYNVKYSDGDFEENVARESMRRLTRRRGGQAKAAVHGTKRPTASKESKTKTTSRRVDESEEAAGEVEQEAAAPVDTTSPMAVGDMVEAFWNEEKWDSGTVRHCLCLMFPLPSRLRQCLCLADFQVITVNHDGTYGIKYVDGLVGALACLARLHSSPLTSPPLASTHLLAVCALFSGRALANSGRAAEDDVKREHMRAVSRRRRAVKRPHEVQQEKPASAEAKPAKRPKVPRPVAKKPPTQAIAASLHRVADAIAAGAAGTMDGWLWTALCECHNRSPAEIINFVEETGLAVSHSCVKAAEAVEAVQQIVEERESDRGGGTEYKVRWRGQKAAGDRWVPESRVRGPELKAADKITQFKVRRHIHGSPAPLLLL